MSRAGLTSHSAEPTLRLRPRLYMATVSPGAKLGRAISGVKADEPVPSIPSPAALPPMKALYLDRRRVWMSVEPWCSIVSKDGVADSS